MDLVPGKMKIKDKGSSGGQKGIQSIIQMMHTEDIKRINIGVGRPNIPVVDYVLGVPSEEDKVLINKAHQKAVLALEAMITKDFNYAMSRYNG